MNRTLIAAFAAVAVAGSLPALAQKPVYKYVYPDGRIVYSDKPVPGATLDTQIEVPPPPDVSAPPAAPARNGAGAKPPVPQADPAKALDQAWEQLGIARQDLEAARARLASGREPIEGERTGTATGGSRLNDAYWARQKANEDAVQVAETRVREAQEAVNRLR